MTGASRTGLRSWPRVAIAAAAVVGLGLGAAGSAVVVGLADGESTPPPDPPGTIGLVAYDSCQSALRELKNAALPHVGPYGFGSEILSLEQDAQVAAPGRDGAESAAAAGGPGSADRQGGYSTTNVHESGVDEPDLVKTDGRRVVTVANGALDVVDVATHKMTARIPLSTGAEDPVYGSGADQLLLDGDRALVMISSGTVVAMPSARKGSPPVDEQVWGSRLVLVDLTGAGKVVGSLRLDGYLLDARQVDSVARVVVRSAPRLAFTYPTLPGAKDGAEERNKGVVENSSIEDWLPRYELDSGGRTSAGQLVECDAVSHPQRYTGSGMLTVLTVDLRRALTTGDPVSIAADGDTVYGTGTNLYVADDHFAHAEGGVAPDERPQPEAQRTEIYQFDISGAGKPVHVASGGVEGTLLNQYSLSEHEGHLRVATTTGLSPNSQSTVSVLTRRGTELARVGRVDGLGKGERIYSVRYLGDIAYLVTFRQTDPLYTVDLSDPAAPRVTGELKITGYSAYLHPVGEGRLLGVGQEATTDGRTTGLQVSLFDTTADGAKRLDQHQVPGGYSEVEGDPHAFLYWPDRDLVVVPVASSLVDTEGGTGRYDAGALVLRVTENAIDEVGMVRHSTTDPGAPPRRALVIGDELWTLGHTHVVVSNLDNLTQLARIAL
jgi:uncharacterized secreted protein with C-terminal beta-propeller domain